jgi:hypothetical protein
LPDAECTPALYSIAQLYLGLGWSVIPVFDNKVAATAWKAYQTHRPTETILQTWFGEQHYPGLAIVTGLISHLLVLDFDDPQLFQQFQSRYAYLVNTRTVQTRRGYHLYFSLAAGVRLTSRQVPGLDLQSDGRYIVAPPSNIDGHTYKVTRGGQPKTLTAHDAQLIQSFLDSLASTPEKFENSPKGNCNALERIPCKSKPETPSSCLTSPDLISLYRHLVPQQGRNEALFKTSLRARDSGLNVQQTVSALANVHTTQPASGSHPAETPDRRHREAERTIQSAFSRPARLIAQPEPLQLPNTVREKLCQLKETRVVRVIEGLRLKGIQPGQPFTTQAALTLLKGIVGRDSVYQALSVCTPDAVPIFTQQNPSPRTPTLAYAATDTKQKLTTKCFVVTEQKPGKSPAHRPARVFILPGNLELAEKLGVKPTRSSDSLTEADLSSAKTTRQAVHRQFIQRRPGHYSRTWLAHRLGVGIRTLHAYNREIPIQVVPTYIQKPIYWSNLKAIPAGLDVPGLFLQDEAGKRYPPRQPIARKLLSKGLRVILVRRGVNYYFYGERPPTVPHLSLARQTTKPSHYVIQQPVNLVPPAVAYPYTLSTKKTRSEPGRDYPPHLLHLSGNQPLKGSPPPNRHQPPRRSKRFYRQPLPDAAQEQQAQRLCAWVKALVDDSTHHISQVNARKLVDEHGIHRIQVAMKRIARRKHVTNPAGFLVTLLRSEAKVLPSHSDHGEHQLAAGR